ncbi:MAG: hypothetical protein GKR89_15770 [Candidatus Latescibacteria bacterium]|nr:hypothetical protein [Candidatus Latescibacterota bacterium]
MLWASWLVREMVEWGAALLLVLGLSEGYYHHVLAQRLQPVEQLRAVLDREMRGLQGPDWERWAGAATVQVQRLVAQLAVEKVPVASEKASAPAAVPVQAAPPVPVVTALAPVHPPPPRRGVLLRVDGVAPDDIVWTAVNQFYAAPYQWGGEDQFGIDCSALVQAVFRQCGVELPRTAAGQFNSRLGVYVGLEDLRPGDLLFFHTRPKPYISHVGIYLGEGQFLHAPRRGQRVEMAFLNDFYQRRFVAGKRLLAAPFGDIASAD